VQYVKRTFDIIASLLITTAVLPMMIGISMLIKLDSKGPVFFKQDRVGKDGKLFKIFKFRTMHVDAQPYAVNPFSQYDPRITRSDRFLRKLSLDEIPQLFNVLNGDMSLVGPRPEMPFIVEQYNDIHRERRNKAIHENMDYDLYYIRNVSFFMDIAILIETPIFAFRGV
jgi:lipopolysaccharide/colanic/teichoic acid biosynthesis glycosyltransferase